MRRLCVAMLLLVGCPSDKTGAGVDTGAGGDTSDTPVGDADGDGFVGSEDCDDTDASVHPGADETCDGIDEDCDTLVDDDPVDGQSWYTDGDGDGYGDALTLNTDCEIPVGGVADGTDCDDADETIHPGATEVCDEVDQDCDGDVDEGLMYADADGDGYGDPDESMCLCDATPDAVGNADDCDDSDVSISPNASESWYDGVDQDCSDTSDYDADADGHDSDAWGGDDCDDADPESRGAEADVVELGAGPDCGTMEVGAMVYGEAAEDQAGTSVSGGGDVNGDGINDLLVGAPYSDVGVADGGAVYVVAGPITGAVSLSDGHARIVGIEVASTTGAQVLGPRDLDADGYGDLIVQSYDSSTGWPIYIFNGPVAGDTLLSTADGVWSPDDFVARLVAHAGDVDGDGRPDVLQYYDSDWSPESTRGVVLLSAPSNGVHAWDEAQAWFSDDDHTNYCPSDMDGAGDVDADGIDEVLIGCNHQGVYLFAGPLSGEYVVSDADATLTSERTSENPLVAGAGDTNGDGYGDVLVSASVVTAEDYTEYCAVYLYLGPLSGAVSAETDASSTWEGSFFDGYVARGEGAVDLDDSGRTDVVIESMVYEMEGYVSGLFIALDPEPGWYSIDDANWGLEDGGRYLGVSSGEVSVGDISGDGVDDLAFSEPRLSTGAHWDGAVWILFGGSI